jgi:Leucine-rich repeat (LRR) protein
VKFLAPEIGSLPSLRKLDLRNNKLKELPAEVGSLGGLQELYLNDNRLEALPEDCFGQLWNLETFECSNNNLTEVPADMTKDNLPNLNVFNLRGNSEGLVLPWALRCVHDQFPIMTDVDYRRQLVKRALAIRKRVQEKVFL